MENSIVNPTARPKLALVRFLTVISRLAVLVIMIVVMSFLSHSFFTVNNLLNI